MFLDIDGNKVFALSFGSARRTFLAHSGWVGNFEDWIATLAPLSASWRTAIYDHRGTGETVVPVEKITPEAMIDDVFRVMEAMKIERCVLAGFSRGTVTALRAVLRDQSRFDGLVLMNGQAGVLAPGATPPPRIPPSKWPGATHRDRLRWFIDRATPEPEADHIKRWGLNILDRATEEAAEKIGVSEPAEPIDWAKRLPEIRIPTLLLHGEKDVLCDGNAMRYIQSLIPGSELVVFEGSGHIPAMVRPLDVAAAINAFFDRRLG